LLIQLEHDTNQLTPRELTLLELFREKGSLTLDDISSAFNLTKGSANITLCRFVRKVDVKSERNPWRSPAVYSLA
jgi:DNA-binding MarR family transcriptional regulator